MRRIAAIWLLCAASIPAAATPAITGADTGARAVIEAAGDARLVMVGELHGTREAPALVAALARHYVDHGPVVVALEVPASEHPRLRAYLASDGNDRARRALRSGAFWNVPRERNDGRRTQAMLELVEAARRLRGAGHGIAVLPFDPAGPGQAHPTRDRDMATILRAGFDALPASGRMLVLTGNRHAMRAMPADSGLRGLDTAAGYLLDLPLHSVNVIGVDWAFQACMSMAEPCRRLEGRYEWAAPGSTTGDRADATRQFDQVLTLPRLTPSPLLEPLPPTPAAAAGR